MSPHLLALPTELLEHILVFLCHVNAPSIQACRQTCRTLNMIITRSILIHYLEHLALLGMYDPLLPVRGKDAPASMTLALPERMAALRAWEDAWNALSGGDGDTGVFWQERRPDLRITLPSQRSSFRNPSSQWSSQRDRRILATIVDPDPPPGPEDDVPWELDHRMFDEFSLGTWYIVSTDNVFWMRGMRGPGMCAIYSYLDLHGCLGEAEVGGVLCGIQSGEGKNRDPMRWTIIDIPVWDVVDMVLSVELDLAIVISIVKTDSPTYEEWKTRIKSTLETNHLAVRPLRFLDGSLHPCAMVPTIRFSVTGTTERPDIRTQVLGDHLLLWILGEDLEPRGVIKLYLISWKQGSVTLLLDDPEGRYGTAHMISNDVVALLQLDPPGIELCRVSNMQNEREGAINDHHGLGGQIDGPYMDKLCTLLLPQLQQGNSSARAGVVYANFHDQQSFSYVQLRYRLQVPMFHVPQRHTFHQSTGDRIISIMLWIQGCELKRGDHSFEFIVRCATLLDYADGHGCTSMARNGGDDGQSASSPLVGDVSTEGGNDDGAVPWDRWGPQATAMFENPSVLENILSGERRAVMEQDGDDQIRIQDYNPYRIRQARASMKSLRRCGGDSHKKEGRADTVTQTRVVESNTIRAGEWFEEDVTTELPYLETVLNMPGCEAFYMKQNQVMLFVDDLSKTTNEKNGHGDGQKVKGFALYNM